MTLLSIAWKSIRQRSLASSLTALSVALGVALMIAVLVINGVIARMFSQSGSGYNLIVGPKGSELQLVLSTIYRIAKPIENLPWRFYQELTERREVEEAIPIALGDYTEEGGFPIVGTLPRYFAIDYSPGHAFKVEGEFLSSDWDAVIGAEVARVNGWGVGSQFRMIHGGRDPQDAHVHDEKFTVRGVLAPTGTPNDRSVFIHLEGFFQIAGHEKPLEEAIAREAEFFAEPVEKVRERYKEDLAREAKEAAQAHDHHGHDHGHHDHGHDHHAHHAVPDAQKEVTSILVLCPPDKPLAGIMLQNKLKEGVQAQAVNPIQVMRTLMDNLVGNIRYALMVLTGLIIVVSGIGIFVSIYNSMSDRKREIAVMRALGARRQQVFSIILLESILLTIGGGLLGLLLGHGLVFVASPIVATRSGLLIDPLHFETVELLILPVLLAMATLIGIVPGMTAYRTDVAGALYD